MQELKLGETVIKFIHTPGHTPGSQCLLVNGNRLLTGDTVFIGSCGRYVRCGRVLPPSAVIADLYLTPATKRVASFDCTRARTVT